MRSSRIYRLDASDTLERLDLPPIDARLAPGHRGHSFTPGKTPVETTARGTASPAAPARPAAPTVPTVPMVGEKELAAIREQARREGYQAGLAEGRAQLEQTSEALAAALSDIGALRETILAGSRHDMVRLVLAIAEQVLQRTFTAEPEAVLKVVERALQAVGRADSVQLRVHPDDLAVVNENRPLYLASLGGLRHIAIEADPTVDRGGCRVESDLGEVDARIATQLEEIRRLLDGADGAGSP